jgi:hypothetical protein
MFAPGEAARPEHRANLDPRTREADEVVRRGRPGRIAHRQYRHTAQKWPELCMSRKDHAGIIEAQRVADEEIPHRGRRDLSRLAPAVRRW